MLDPFGIVFQPFPALVNHSCQPNCIVRFDLNGLAERLVPRYGSISIQSLRDIPQNEEITISYIDASFPFAQRQTQLRDRYYFTCNCSLCAQKEETVNDRLESKSVAGQPPVSPVGDNTQTAELQAQAERTFYDVQSKPGIETTQIPHLRSALQSLASTSIWPVHRYPFPQLRQQLALALLERQDFSGALVHFAILYRIVDPLYHAVTFHPVRMSHAWTFWNITFYCASEQQDERERYMLAMLSFHVVDELFKDMQKHNFHQGEMERMVVRAYEGVREGNPLWQSYERSKDKNSELALAWLDARIRQTLESERVSTS